MVIVEKNGNQLAISELVLEAHERKGWVYIGAADKTPIDTESMTVEQLKTFLDEQGIDFDASAKKAELLELATAIS